MKRPRPSRARPTVGPDPAEAFDAADALEDLRSDLGTIEACPSSF